MVTQLTSALPHISKALQPSSLSALSQSAPQTSPALRSNVKMVETPPKCHPHRCHFQLRNQGVFTPPMNATQHSPLRTLCHPHRHPKALMGTGPQYLSAQFVFLHLSILQGSRRHKCPGTPTWQDPIHAWACGHCQAMEAITSKMC
jgi:hypothetical protein